MKKVFLCFLLIPCVLSGISIYEIQYTTAQGDGTYPSPYAGQIVTTGGIVSATDFLSGQFFITSSNGGAWNGLYIYDNNYQFSTGDSLVLTGRVYEYYGFTEISPLQTYQLISSGNPLPEPVSVSTYSVQTLEANESVLVSVSNASVISGYDGYNQFLVSDGSGNCQIYDSFFRYQNLPALLPLPLHYQFAKIVGIVGYQYSNYRLNPRSLADFYSPDNGVIVTTESISPTDDETFILPLKIHFYGSYFNCESYQFAFHYDDTVLSFHNIIIENTLSASGEIFYDELESGTVLVNFSGDFSFINSGTLLNISLQALQEGTTSPTFSDFSMNDFSVNWMLISPITVYPLSETIGDTITVIQRPLLNLPVFITPGQEFEIQCIAPPSTTQWQAELIHNQKIVPLTITEQSYNSAVQRWFLNAIVLTVDIFELYDLRVTASGGIEDVTAQSVSVLPHFKTNYYFAHITDSHLPTHLFYENEESLADSTEMNDLREVFKDLNVIRPEFVLFTGDIVNEGELEDFQNRRYYTKAQRMMKELEVPVFVVAGNHDIGGWVSTPPPQGTARRNWWKFFGWNYLENPFASEYYHTQNYSFFYDEIQFIGMESYNNYDSFMYSVYGSDSFISEQMSWLQNELTVPSTQKVLFYHRDFSNQINLSQLNVDMALSGHIHSNNGSVYQHPYDLSTDAICDGKRSYRIIEVNDGQLIPNYTIDSGATGNKISLSFQPSNDGSASSVMAFLQNFQPIPFPNTLIKFVMPANSTDFDVENGTLWQVDFSGEFPICYVRVNLAPNSNVTVNCLVTDSVSDNVIVPNISQFSGFPNPVHFSNEQRNFFTISFTPSLDEWGELSIFNVKGQKVKTLYKGEMTKNNKYSFNWNGKDERNLPVATGVYFYQLKTSISMQKKFLLIR